MTKLGIKGSGYYAAWALGNKDHCFRYSFVIAVSILSFILDGKVGKAYTFANAFSRCETRSPKANIIAELQKNILWFAAIYLLQ